MKQRGLGTGLSALFGEAALDNNDFEYLPLIRVEPRPGQPRSVFEQEKIDELAESIREHGILSPLTVRRIENDLYQIIAGERRWRAARLAGLTSVPVRIVEADDKKAYELALVENLQREDLNPLEEARGYRVLMEEFDMTQEEVAQKVSKSRPTVANAMRLLGLPSEILEFIQNGSLTAGSARALIAIKNPAQMQSAAQKIIRDGLNVREVEALVRKLNSQKSEFRSDDEVNYMLEAQKRLTMAFGRRVTIRQQGKDKGRIEIEYYNDEDFNELFVAFVAMTGGSTYE